MLFPCVLALVLVGGRGETGRCTLILVECSRARNEKRSDDCSGDLHFVLIW